MSHRHARTKTKASLNYAVKCGLACDYINFGHVWTTGVPPPPYIYHFYCLLTSPGNLGMSGRQGSHPHLISIISTVFSPLLVIWCMSGRQGSHPHLISIISTVFSPPLVIWGLPGRQELHPHLISIISNALSPSPDIMRHMQSA